MSSSTKVKGGIALPEPLGGLAASREQAASSGLLERDCRTLGIPQFVKYEVCTN